MIKENKKNKLITFLCACLMVCASALGLVSAVGTTFASSPTQPTITTSYFNYKDSNFLNLFDGYITKYKSGITTQLVYTITHVTDLPSSYSTSGFTIDGLYYLSGSNVYSQNTFVAGVFTTDGMFGGLPSITYTFANSTDLFAGINDVYSRVLVFSYNGTYYTICPVDLYTKHIAYMEGMADADTTSAYNNGYNTGYAEGQTNGYNSGVTQGQNNVINNPNNYDLYTQAQYEQNYTNGYNSGVTQGQNNVINNPNAYGLYTQAQYQQNYTDGYNAGVIQGQNNVINNPNDFGLNTNQQLQDSYNQGFADGEQSTDAYQNGYDTGYTDGSNEVLNNPNSYGLYTLAQYEQNYQDGYIAGVQNSQYGVLSNVQISGLVEINDDVTGINNNDFTFNAGTITPNSSLLNKLNTIFNSSFKDYAIAQIEFTFSEQYIYSRDNIINFVNLSLLPNQTSYLPVTYITNSNQSVALIYSFNPIIENNVFTGYNVGIIGDSNGDTEDVLIGNTIKSFIITYAITNIDGITLTRDNLVKPQAISIFANNVAFNNGYTLGYNDAMNSDIVNNAYNNGYTDGNRVGYQQGLSNGLANANDYTFFGLIGAVIDAPIQYLSSLFNFNVLGFNLLAFITSLFTVCVIIWIVKMLLGGK